MADIQFCKFHGFGNDYIVIERSQLLNSISHPDLALALCDRHKGVGSDGVVVVDVLDGTVADFGCEILNPDGSFAGFSGNGTRCAVAYLYYKGLWTAEVLRLRTRSGVKVYKLLNRTEREFEFQAEIGRPRFSDTEVPVLTSPHREHVVNVPVALAGGQYTFSAVNVGNPVACIFIDNFDIDWRQIGRELETHAMFPERTNVVFVNVLDRENVEVRIWERGAGETNASGTCASAAAVMSSFLLKTGREVMVHSPGGTTDIVWRDDDEMIITGKADLAFSGTWQI